MSKNPAKAPATVTDNLKEDPPISGQNWAVVSFVNPADNVLNKLLYYTNNFMITDINKQITAQAVQMVRQLSVDMRQKITDVLDKLKFSLDEEDKNLSRLLEKRYREMLIDEDEYVDKCRRKYELDEEELGDRYKIYLAENRTRLDKEYDDAHDHQCSLRGFKVRGVFARYEDADIKGKYLRDNVEPAIHAFVAPVGVWVPIDIDADEVQNQDYMLPQLNELMGKYHEGVHARNLHYQERQREMMQDGSEKKSTKERLQDKLRQKRNEQRRKEVTELRGAAEGDVATTDVPKKSKKNKKSKSKKAAPVEAAPVEAAPVEAAPVEAAPAAESTLAS